jgi:phosphate acetyltransferase
MTGKHEKYQRLLDFCKTLTPTPTAVAHSCDDSSLEGAVGAARLELHADTRWAAGAQTAARP